MKHILVIYTGGTICTASKEGLRSCQRETAYALPTLYMASDSPFREEVRFTDGEYFGILSENMSISAWNRLLSYLRGALSTPGYDGILIAHGTDSLSYTAALLSAACRGISLPILLISANAPIQGEDGTPNPHSNGNANFRAGVECICQGIRPGVYVPYRNPSTGKTYLHLGAHLEGCRNYSEDFYSKDALLLSTPLPPLPWPEEPVGIPLLLRYDAPLSDCVLKIAPYPGLHYGRLSLSGVACVLHGTYHSGTACVRPLPPEGGKTDPHQDPHSLLFLAEECKKAGAALYFSPALSPEEGETYDTVPQMQEAAGKECLLYGFTEESAYARLLLAYAWGLSPKEKRALLFPSDTAHIQAAD